MNLPQDATSVPAKSPVAATAQAGVTVENHISPIIQNNITIEAPRAPAIAARPARRSGGGGRASATPRAMRMEVTLEDGPQGFTLDAPSANVEAMRAQQNDEGQRNVEVRIEAQRSVYIVSEEIRRRPGGNASLQNVGAVVDTAHAANTRAFVSSTQGRSHSTLEGYANGTVILNHTQNGVSVRTDITGASSDITASGIRLLQERVARDGEVDRVEQQQILNLVAQAREVAATRR